jgi:hypothetical protein
MKMKKTRTVLCSLALLSLLACGLAPVKIGDIMRDPTRFENQTVTLHGTAKHGTKLPFMSHSVYEVDDGTGTLAVLTKGALPAEGKRVLVRGKIRTAFRVGGESFGVVLMEGE